VSTATQTLAPDASPSDSQPVTAIKTSKSRKAPAIKTAVILSRANGKPWAHIAKDLKIAVNTAKAIAEESDIDRQMEVGRFTCATLIPEAITAIGTQLKKGDGELGRKFLNDMGVIGENAKNSPGPEQIHLSQAINIMFKQQGPQTQADTTQPVIEVNAAPEDK